PLRLVPLRPDPLTAFARGFAHFDDDTEGTVAVDLRPLSPAQRRRLRRRLTANSERPGGGLMEQMARGGLALPGLTTSPRSHPRDRGRDGHELRATAQKL